MTDLYFILSTDSTRKASHVRCQSIARALEKQGIVVEEVYQFKSIPPDDKLNKGFLLLMLKKLFLGIVGHLRLLSFILSSKTKKAVLYFYNPMMITTLPSLLVAHLAGRKVVVDKTELFQHEKNTWYNRLGDKWAFRYATIPFAISDRLIEFGRRHTDKAIVKLPIVVDFDRFNSSINPSNKLIGYVGTSAAKDGLDIVLKGFAKASVQDSALRLRLIGPKPTFFDFDKLVAELGIEDSIELIGSKSFEQIPQLLLECDTFIMNRDNSLFAQLGYPTKLGEYFACKRPVLMSNGPGFSEDFTDKVQSIMYEVNNSKALAGAILWRYHNPDEANKIANEGYSFAKQHFSSEVVTSILINTLKEQAILA